MNISDLKRRTVKGFFWNSLESIISQGQGIIFGIFLARILSPEDFGLLGMITIFISIAQVFVDSGLSQSLIRKQDCSNIDYNTVFWVNIIIGTISYLIIWILAPSIADFFGKPELLTLTRVSSLAILIGSVTLIQQTIYIKEVDFKIMAKSSAIGTFISGVISLILAFLGFGVWSLVWRTIINQVVRSYILWSSNRWRPKLTYSRLILKEHFSFGSNLLFISLISALYKNFYSLIIGKNYSEKILGFYTNAEQYSLMPSSTITGITGKVSYPVLSRIQNDNKLLRSSLKKLITTVMYISFVLMLGLASFAKPLFIVVLGEKWLPSVVIFQVLCLAYAITPMHVINHNIMKVRGRADLFFKTEIIKYIILTPILIIGALYGINFLIGGIVVFYWIGFCVNAIYSKKLVGYSALEQSSDLFKVMGIPFFAALITWGLGSLITWNNIFLLMFQVFIYSGLVLSLSIILRIPAFFEIKQILQEKITITNVIKTISKKE